MQANETELQVQISYHGMPQLRRTKASNNHKAYTFKKRQPKTHGKRK